MKPVIFFASISLLIISKGDFIETASVYFPLALLVLFFSCAFLTGLIWIIQRVHYPIFPWIKDADFPQFHAFHSRRITWVVGPTMALELALSILIVIQSPRELLALVNLSGVLSLWLLTFFVSVPCHQQLAKGFDPRIHQRLVLTNWWRTGLWSLRSLLLLYWIGSLP